ncbi:hypothetical protein D7Z54_16595 [Salibacterium salarium]|uniref:Type IV pilus assembly protein PilO n=1 Tax=Salibacterium salarium TaxID=284579 RepID=A0A3R9P6H4_9BACI|nr:hypothetical protein [Salibacterium salarium]RSL32269.1 hypothetical protein D7Z54_16595 [Salibacterium salarium]
MRVNVERLHWVVLIVAGLSIVGISCYQYISTIQPLQSSQQTLAEEIEVLENRLGEAERESIASSKDVAADLYALQRELPLQPMPDEILLELDRAEEMSDSYILSIEKLDEVETTAADSEADIPEEEIATEERGEATPFSYLVRVRTPQYENVASFLESIDQSTRLLNVDMLRFDGREKQVWEDEEPAPLTTTIILTAFYYPETE